METQLSFSSLEHQTRKKPTRRQEFLSRMDGIVPWAKIIELVKPHYYNNKIGRPPTPLEVILRMYFLQIWFSLADKSLEEAIYDSMAFRSFIGADTISVSIPDETVLFNFRKMINDNGLGDKIFLLVKDLLEKNGLIMHGGTIMDATIHEAPKSVRNASQERDPEMASTKKHGSYHYGAKSHIGVDAQTGYIHSVEVTPANEHDITVAHKLIRPDDKFAGGDSGYIGMDKRDEFIQDPHLSNVECRAVQRPSSWKKKALSEVAKEFDRQDERRLISIRQKVEYVFLVLKKIFKFVKLPYKGLLKNRTRLMVSYANANLYMVATAGPFLSADELTGRIAPKGARKGAKGG